MKLLPCPACNEDGAVEDHAHYAVFISCDNRHCNVRGPNVLFDRSEPSEADYERAGALWNEMPRRVPSPMLKQDLTRLRSALAALPRTTPDVALSRGEIARLLAFVENRIVP